MHVCTVTIDSSLVSADLSDFVVYIDLSDLPASFWDVVANGGGDIRVYKSDGTTELAREVVSCDTATDTGELHVKYAGTLSSSLDTEIQIHADGSSSDYAVTATYGRNNVWSAYEMVYHMDGTTDSTGNGHSLTASGATLGDSIGKLGGTGGATNFDGADNYAYSADVDPGAALTVTLWANADSFPSGQATMVAKWTASRAFIFQEGEGSYQEKLVAYMSQAGSFEGGNVTYGSTSMSTDWQHCAFTFSGANTRAKVYLDGTEDGQDTSAGSSIKDTSDAWTIGGQSTANNYDGQIDEVRIAFSEFSSDWIDTEHENQNSPSTFYSVTAVSSGTDVTATPNTQAATLSIPTYNTLLDYVLSVATQTATFSVIARTTAIGATFVATVQSAAFTLIGYVIDAGGNITKLVNTQSATFSAIARSIFTSITKLVNTQSATFSAVARSILTGVTKTVNTVTSTFSAIARTVGVTSSITIAVNTATATFSAVSRTIIAIVTNKIITVSTQVLTFSIATIRKVGGVWSRSGRNNTGDWTRSSRNDA